MKRELGLIDQAKIDIKEPLSLNFDAAFRQIVILIAPNAGGKTLILKLSWVFGTLAMMTLEARKHAAAPSSASCLQYLLDHTFDDRCIDGEIEFTFEKGGSIGAVVEKGVVKSVTYDFDEDIIGGSQPIFMSKETRLLGDIIKYIKFKKIAVVPQGLPVVEEEMHKLLELYKLYDIIYMESLLHRIEFETTPKVIKEFNERMDKFDEGFKITDIKVDYLKQDILYTDDKSVTKSVSTLGAGHQSLMNMILYQSY